MRNFEHRHDNIPVYTIVINPFMPPKPPAEEIVVTKEVAKSALKLEDARKITLSGDLTGAVLFDGSEDVTLKAISKFADRAVKDGKGNEISETYARKNELEKYALKSEIKKKLNYFESILYATKEAVNEYLNEKNVDVATDEDLDNLFDESSIDEGSLATEDDIDALFGD